MEQKPSNTNAEKKWYLYVVEDVEGPLTIQDIKERIKFGEARETSYVWSENISDWTVLNSLEEFGYSNLKIPSSDAQNKLSTAQPISASNALGFNRPLPTPTGPVKKPKKTKAYRESSGFFSFLFKTAFAVILIASVYQFTALGTLDPLWKKIGVDEKISSMHLPILPVSAFVDPVLTPIKPTLMSLRKKIAKKVPAQYRKYILPVVLPSEANEKDHDVLLEAALTPIENGGRLAASLVEGTTSNPQFVIASNLPNGTQVEIHLSGKPGTLVGVQNAEAIGTATLLNNIGVSDAIAIENAKSLPPGEYIARIYDSDEQKPDISIELAAIPKKAGPETIPDKRTAFTIEQFFLGGERNETYTNALKEYNDKLAEQKKSEIEEATQFQATIESLANESASRFFKIANSKIASSKKQRIQWLDYSKSFRKISAQIFTQLENNPQIPTTRIYPSLHEATKAAFQSSEELHALETLYFENRSTIPDIQQKAGTTLELINTLKKQIQDIQGTY